MNSALFRLSFIASLAAAHAAAATFYVAPNGDDVRGDGSAGKPWATISGAVRKAPAEGGTVLVRPGVYDGTVRVSRQFQGPLLIRSENPYQAQLRSEKAVLLIRVSANIEMAGFEIFRVPPTGRPEALAVHISRSQAIVLRDNIIHDSYNNDLLKINEQASEILITGNVFYNQEGRAGQHIDVNGCRNVFIAGNIFFNDFAGTGVDGSKTHGFIVIKNSGNVPESRRIQVARNIFLNFEGSDGSNFILLGEDGRPFHETQEILIENNLLIGNSRVKMRAPLGIKGVRDVIFRNNTITGDLPSAAFAMRLNREGRNPANQGLQFINNIWSSAQGTMATFSNGAAAESRSLTLDNNAYWNGGQPVPRDNSVLQSAFDKRAVVEDPRLPWTAAVLPKWEKTKFRSGKTSIREEFDRLVTEFGTPPSGSPVVGRADPALAAVDDIRGTPRGPQPDLGAVQRDAAPPAMVLLLMPARIMGGDQTRVNRIVLNAPAPSKGLAVQLTSSSPAISVPRTVRIAAGEDSAAFAITTSTVKADTPVTLTAAAAGKKAQATATVVPQGVVSVNPREYIVSTGDSEHYLMLEGPAVEGTQIEMSSSRPDLITFPRIDVPAGKSWASFTLQSKPVTAETPVQLIAAIGASRREETITLRPGQVITSVKLSLEDAFNGASFTATVSVSEPAADDKEVVVNLRSEMPDVVVVPATVRIPPGQLSATVPVQTKPYRGRKNVGIAASINEQQRTAWVEVGTAEAGKFELYPARGTKTAGVVRLTTPAPPGFQCTIVSSRPDLAAAPATVSIREGGVRAQFPVQLSAGYDSAPWTLSATCGAATLTASLPR